MLKSRKDGCKMACAVYNLENYIAYTEVGTSTNSYSRRKNPGFRKRPRLDLHFI